MSWLAGRPAAALWGRGGRFRAPPPVMRLKACAPTAVRLLVTWGISPALAWRTTCPWASWSRWAMLTFGLWASAIFWASARVSRRPLGDGVAAAGALGREPAGGGVAWASWGAGAEAPL